MTIKGGYYIKARCIKDSWIAHSAPVVRETWDYLLREANHKERKYNGYIIKRGQLFRTYRQIRDDLSWMVGASRRTYTVDQMKHTMKLLAKHAMITPANTPRGVIITICKYVYYQNPKNYESTTESAANTPANTPRIHQASPTINKNVKNEKNLKNKTNKEFNYFYSIYPIKKSREDAFVAWQQLFVPGYAKKNDKTGYIGMHDGLFKRICEAVEAQIKEKEYSVENGSFVTSWPYPASWLRDKRWNDEIEPEKPTTKKLTKREELHEALKEE